ncbi:hypothetical protein [Ottowia oryzae]
MVEYIAIYLGLMVLVMAWLAYVGDDEDRIQICVCLLWPAFVVFAIAYAISLQVTKRTGWRINIELRRDLSAFGFRKPDSPVHQGRALRVLWVEVQVWNPRRNAAQKGASNDR